MAGIVDFIKDTQKKFQFLKWVQIIPQESLATKKSALYFVEKNDTEVDAIVIDDLGQKRKLTGGGITIDLKASNVVNDSLVIGSSVKDALETITQLLSNEEQERNIALEGKVDKPLEPNNIPSRVILADGTTKPLSEITTDLSGYATTTDLDAEIVNRSLADTNLQGQITTEKNRNDTQDAEINLLKNKPKLISTDDSILIEENDIGAMLSFFYEEFSNQDILLSFTPMVILGVYKNGLLLNDDEFILTLPKNIVINNYTTNDKIKIQYQHLKTDLYEYNISN